MIFKKRGRKISYLYKLIMQFITITPTMFLSRFPNTCHTFGEFDFFQRTAVVESFVSDRREIFR